MLRCVAAVVGALVATVIVGAARAADCPGNPDALGTSRTIVIDPTEHRRLGAMQYPESLPLAPKEVVITFDDGPLPPYTKQVLGLLAAQCVKVTYFLVGSMARAYPETVREIFNAGHSIGTHSQNHPLTFHRMPIERAQQEIEQGIASVTTALGDANAVAPFFRIPGLMRADPVEAYLASRALVTWSADIVADDWHRRIGSADIARRAVARLEAAGSGILLLHDIHAKTVAALPAILHELKVRGFHVVHVVPATPDLPKTATDPALWLTHKHEHLAGAGRGGLPAFARANPSYGVPFVHKTMMAILADNDGVRTTIVRLRSRPAWPRTAAAVPPTGPTALPVPGPQSFALPNRPDSASPGKRVSRILPRHPTRPAKIEKRPAAQRSVPHLAVVQTPLPAPPPPQ